MYSIISAIILSAATAFPQAGTAGVVTDALTPQFELKSGIKATDGKENCLGIILNGKQLIIPCECPPNREAFLKKLQENVDAGSVLGRVPVRYQTGDSLEDKLARIDAATATLQSFSGQFGIGCPAASTTFVKQRQALQPIQPVPVIEVPPEVQDNGAAISPSPNPEAGNSTTPSTSDTNPAESTSAAGALDESLVPEFGVQQGTNPTGTGDCDGVNGKKIPCFCPPNRSDFIRVLGNFVKEGNVFGTPISFPTGDSNADKRARIEASVIALQSFNGTKGVGCPIVSTTLGAQRDALQL